MTATSVDQLPITHLKGVGDKVADKFKKLHIFTVQDLLFHFPTRYQDRTQIQPIGGLQFGQQVVVEGLILMSDVVTRGRRSLLCKITDDTGFLTLRFFYFNYRQQQALAKGVQVRCFGEVRRGAVGLELIHPEYRILNETDEPLEEGCHLTPIYPSTEGMHQLTLTQQTSNALLALQQHPIPDFLPENIREELQLPALVDAIHFIHRPPNHTSIDLLASNQHPAQQRLVFEELLAHQLSLRRLRKTIRVQQAPILITEQSLQARFLATLPFALTNAQQRVIADIQHDISQAAPMLRLVQGDVGCGKTLVAACAALTAAGNGYQVAIMAPTELLAEQHYLAFRDWLSPMNISVGFLSGGMKASQKKIVTQGIAQGEIMVAIGTHALFQQEIEFHRLALVIVDEQHRFGVHQRLALRDKGKGQDRLPHQLTMTATPIPRTLSMSLYADLDISVIDELPPGRIPVATLVVPDTKRSTVVEKVHQCCKGGEQVYWVCTLIEESEALQCQAASETAIQLAEALPDISVALIHGRMKSQEKEQIMRLFKQGEIQLLVATTVIEVGVNVPNASLMVIENAERLGLAQLHQLRGRVGRGNQKSNCILMYQGKLSRSGFERLNIMRATNDGFKIAQKDLEIRGPGELMGVRQTGMQTFQIADLQRDQAMIPLVQELADRMLAEYPELVQPLVDRWLGHNTQYGNV